MSCAFSHGLDPKATFATGGFPASEMAPTLGYYDEKLERESTTRISTCQEPVSGLPRRSLTTSARSRIALRPSPRNEDPCIVARVIGFKAASRCSVLSVYGV